MVWTYSGVRPLYDDGASSAQEATRDYVLDLEAPDGQAPLLSVFGGKITTYRRLAEARPGDASSRISHSRSAAGPALLPLPGGDFPYDGVGQLVEALRRDFPFLTAEHASRLVRAYGTRARDGARRRAAYRGSGPQFRRRPDRSRGTST